MPASIKILPQYVANRISAGEVVGRPEAVVKELFENSIDAGANNIELRIKDAGKTLIQVIDDGSGMSHEDALLCFHRHSTSKISSAEDLEYITTLGFRGEALASISAVSQVELKTRIDSEEFGTFIKNHGSEVVETSPLSAEQISHGTSLTVKNLFYNTPARRNFLKTNQTEFNHIYNTFIRLAISNPEISFKFINNDEEIFDLEKADLQKRLLQILGMSFIESLIEVKQEKELISLNGFISKPSFTKKTKQDQFLFLNRRFFINKSISYAVHMAYEDLIEKGDYPSYFLFLKLDPGRFDVNVHPSKLEVKFEQERAVFGFVLNSVKETLNKNDLVAGVNLKAASFITPLMEGRNKSDTIPQSFNQQQRDDSGFVFRKHIDPETLPKIHEMFKQTRTGSSIKAEDFNSMISGNPAEVDFKKDEIESFTHKGEDTLISKNTLWQFHKKYIMYQLENSLMIIDQHAAHERILYEQALDRLNSNANLSQQLLLPIYVELNPVDFEVVKSVENELKSLGFDIQLMSKRKIKIQGIPSDVRLGDEGKILQEIIDEYKENDVKLNLEKRDNLAKSYACKHAVKTGDKLTEDEMLNLIDKLFSTKMPYVCPHGRPTILKMSIEELDKKFARTGF